MVRAAAMDARGGEGRTAAAAPDVPPRAPLLRRVLAVSCALAVPLAVAWWALGPPPMEQLSAAGLDRAERLWHAAGSASYRLAVRVRAPRAKPAVYEVVVAGGQPIRVERDGVALAPREIASHDYSVAGLFELLRQDLHLVGFHADGDVPPVDLRVRFEPATGRPVRYRRTVGAARRRVLLVEVLRYEPLAGVAVASRG